MSARSRGEEIREQQKRLRYAGSTVSFHEVQRMLENERSTAPQPTDPEAEKLNLRIEQARPFFMEDGFGLRGPQSPVTNLTIDGADGKGNAMQVKRPPAPAQVIPVAANNLSLINSGTGLAMASLSGDTLTIVTVSDTATVDAQISGGTLSFNVIPGAVGEGVYTISLEDPAVPSSTPLIVDSVGVLTSSVQVRSVGVGEGLAVTSGSTVTFDFIRYYNPDVGLPLLHSTATNPDVTDDGEMWFRNIQDDGGFGIGVELDEDVIQADVLRFSWRYHHEADPTDDNTDSEHFINVVQGFTSGSPPDSGKVDLVSIKRDNSGAIIAKKDTDNSVGFKWLAENITVGSDATHTIYAGIDTLTSTGLPAEEVIGARFKKLKAGTGIELSGDSDKVIISATGGTGEGVYSISLEDPAVLSSTPLIVDSVGVLMDTVQVHSLGVGGGLAITSGATVVLDFIYNHQADPSGTDTANFINTAQGFNTSGGIDDGKVELISIKRDNNGAVIAKKDSQNAVGLKWVAENIPEGSGDQAIYAGIATLTSTGLPPEETIGARFKKLKAGTGINFTGSDTNVVKINSTGGGGVDLNSSDGSIDIDESDPASPDIIVAGVDYDIVCLATPSVPGTADPVLMRLTVRATAATTVTLPWQLADTSVCTDDGPKTWRVIRNDVTP